MRYGADRHKSFRPYVPPLPTPHTVKLMLDAIQGGVRSGILPSAKFDEGPPGASMVLPPEVQPGAATADISSKLDHAAAEVLLAAASKIHGRR